MERQKLQKKRPFVLPAETRALIKQLREDLAAEQENNNKAYQALEAAKHEIIDIQRGYYSLVQKAEQNASAKTRKRVQNEFEFRIRELEIENEKLRKQLLKAGAGKEHSCPECGSIIVPIPYEPR